MTDQATLFDRIIKLHRKAVSAKEIGSEAEAMIFADMVQRLLIKHDLELSEVEYQAQLAEDPVKLHKVHISSKRRSALWQELIARHCALAHLCQAIPVTGRDAFVLIGRRQHRQVAEFMSLTLIRLGADLAQKAYIEHFYRCKEAGDVTQARGFKKAFLLGFAARVSRRYQAMMLETAARYDKGTGLIRLSQEQALCQQLVDTLTKVGAMHEVRQTLPTLNKPASGGGFAAGVKAGNAVNLKANVVEAGQATGQRALPAGQKLLGGA